ncbi:sulfite exporter TauE/SafE family protein [Formosa sediminum]|uniref:Sulfite exporter TauE/SafE family protein n=1 Tax=Formosa sediminum TaxID=2594004 RepID=A0A516GSV1_9FLAO|nr:aromatic aminobenezylarsenical efflux permease ArsG family transporter [Formosa sediminum]QDO94589.1 sulfite exporter TauE/SafE family protein [Formosa sediminum]
MDALQTLISQYNIPIVSAFILGLMTAISPCPLATNITATAFISKNIASKKKVFISGLSYSLGRGFSYTTIGLILYFGASKFHIARFFNQNGEKYLGPLLIVIGLIMLNIIKLNFLGKSSVQEQLSIKFKDKGIWGAFLIGLVFALAFCPYSGALFFGILIPMTMTSSDGLFLPIVFALGTGLPVIIFTYLLAFTAGKLGLFYNKITKIENIMRKTAGIVFILTGVYYVAIFLM